MKCEVDPKTLWCARHQTFHVGRLYDLSQDESELGERYRTLWDRQRRLYGAAKPGDPFEKKKAVGAARILLRFHQCPGDTLCATPAVRALALAYPEYAIRVQGGGSEAIFAHNPFVQDFEGRADEEVKLDNSLIHSSHLPWHFLHSYVHTINNALGVNLSLGMARPEVFLADDEKATRPIPHRYWLLNAGCKKDYTVKRWPAEYFQEVIDALQGRVTFVQVGQSKDDHPPLRRVINFIDKTDLRQLITLAYHADGALTPESFLHHLMAAHNKPCVTLAAGWLSKHWITYQSGHLLSRHGCLDCCREKACGKARVVETAPKRDPKNKRLCLLPVLDTFSQPVAKCMALIKPPEVVRAIGTYLEGLYTA